MDQLVAEVAGDLFQEVFLLLDQLVAAFLAPVQQ
jgi:hypothetical protein